MAVTGRSRNHGRQSAEDCRDRRRRHRQGGRPRRPARARGGRETPRHRPALRRVRFRLLRLLREAWRNDARGLEGPDRRSRRDLLRRRRMAGNRAGPCLALGVAASVPPSVRPVRESAACPPDARRPLAAGGTGGRRHRLLDRPRETPRASTRPSAARCSRGPSARSSCRRR